MLRKRYRRQGTDNDFTDEDERKRNHSWTQLERLTRPHSRSVVRVQGMLLQVAVLTKPRLLIAPRCCPVSNVRMLASGLLLTHSLLAQL